MQDELSNGLNCEKGTCEIIPVSWRWPSRLRLLLSRCLRSHLHSVAFAQCARAFNALPMRCAAACPGRLRSPATARQVMIVDRPPRQSQVNRIFC